MRSTGLSVEGRTVTTRPSPHGSTVMSAPASASISSVWVRVVTASRTTVVPSADRPASRMADFTCTLATFDVQSMPRRAPPRTRSGGRQRSPWPSTAAPISAERLGHPVHGTHRERLVADELGLPGEAGDEAAQQPHGGARIAAVERVRRLVQDGCGRRAA